VLDDVLDGRIGVRRCEPRLRLGHVRRAVQ
jgi:hypothetical protein